MSGEDSREYTAEELLADQKLMTNHVILPALYLMSGAVILILMGGRKDRGALARDLANVQAVIAGLMGIRPDGQDVDGPPDSGQ